MSHALCSLRTERESCGSYLEGMRIATSPSFLSNLPNVPGPSSAASQGASASGVMNASFRDTFTPSGESEGSLPHLDQLLRVAFGGKPDAGDGLREVGKLAQQRKEGGFMTKAELQKSCPQIFADLSQTDVLPTSPARGLPKVIANLFDGAAQNLFYSNNPERLRQSNVRLADAELPAGRTRVVSHHLNDTEDPMQLSTVFRNSGSQPVVLTFLREAGRVDDEGMAARVGLDTYQDYLRDRDIEVVTIEPGKSHVWDQGVMEKGEVATSMAMVSTNGPLSATTMATAAGADPERASLETPALEGADRGRVPLEFRGSGLYPDPDTHVQGTIPMGEPKIYQMVMGPQGKSGTFDGEYGQERRITLRVGDDVKPGQRLTILAWAGGADPVGVRPLSDPSQVLAIATKPQFKEQVAVLFEGEVEAGQLLHMEQMVQAGAATPLRLLIVPVPPAQGSDGSQKKEDRK